MLDVDALCAGYSGPVVGPLSFHVDAGETVGLWGPNGSGKSTLLKAIIGTAGLFGGRIHRAHGLTIAYQGQQPRRLPSMPIRARELLDALGVTPDASCPQRLARLLNTRIDRLSGGQFQLLTVWSRLAGNARMVCLDEPTNNLDPQGVVALGELLTEPHPDRGVLLVSHERTFMERVCDRIVEVQSWSG
ncbi:ATP-binding cassette domain-containing protein [Ectothiorhodospiraceae bacterium WFHF3C12]|nr:ATP-binding cassette domain-containing protein [Ectothiorhodospiraceae bacterium WFHF3C12]